MSTLEQLIAQRDALDKQIKAQSEGYAIDAPVLVGTLTRKEGITGFVPAEIGHPVFDTGDRYVIYLQSIVELKERVYDPVLQGHQTKIGYFTVAIPYYKKTLLPYIKLTPNDTPITQT
jgi:hypothetical protein